MKNKLSLIILLFVLTSLLCHIGCVTTTQKGTAIGAGTGAGIGALIGSISGNAGMGAAIGAGAGALGGALVGDYIDNKREQTEKAQMNRQLEMERKVPVKSDYYNVRETPRSEGTVYSNVINIDEDNKDLFTRYWGDDHWIYTPTHNPDDTNLFMRVKSNDGRWDYVPITEEVESDQDKQQQEIETIIKTIEPDQDKHSSPIDKDNEEDMQVLEEIMRGKQ